MNNEVINDLSSLRFNKMYRIWKPFMQKYNCERICEIGVRTGDNFLKMIKHNPKVAVAIDIWKNDGVVARNDIGWSNERLEEQYQRFMDKVKDKPFVKVYRDYSFNVVKECEDNFFDLVYIDADHTYNGCYKDIIDWYPKVKQGGILLGDDYVKHKTRTGVEYGVIEAVNKFARDNKLSFFVFPRSKWGIIK